MLLLFRFPPSMPHLMKCEHVRSRFKWYVKIIYCMNIKLVFSHFFPSIQFWWDNKKPHVSFVGCASHIFSPINWCCILWKIFETKGVAQYDSLTIKVLNTINIQSRSSTQTHEKKFFPYFLKVNEWCSKPTQNFLCFENSFMYRLKKNSKFWPYHVLFWLIYVYNKIELQHKQRDRAKLEENHKCIGSDRHRYSWEAAVHCNTIKAWYYCHVFRMSNSIWSENRKSTFFIHSFNLCYSGLAPACNRIWMKQ